MYLKRPLAVACALAAATVLVAGLSWVYAQPTLPDVNSGAGRCELLADRYGLTPCPPDPLPLERVEIKNADPGLSDARAREIGEAYLRSRTLYYLAVRDNSTRLFDAPVLHRPDESPMMFDAETRHIRDARAQHGRVVLTAQAHLRRILVVPLPAQLRTSLGTRTLPIASAIVVEAQGPEEQVIRVPGRPDLPVSTMSAGDSYRLLVGGVLLHPVGLGETFAEQGQWECLDPDTKGACLS